jgi:hypothetical protein
VSRRSGRFKTSLVQIKPPQLEVFSFQLLRDTLQPSELTIRLLNVVKTANVRLSLGDEDEYVGKWPATPEQCGDFIQADLSLLIVTQRVH